MALGKYSRVDGKKTSSSYWSTAIILVFVALCLVGVWMITSSSLGPPQSGDLQDNRDEFKDQVTDMRQAPIGNDYVQQFEDNNGDLSEDATKNDQSQSGNNDSQDRSTQNPAEDNQEEKAAEESAENDLQSENTPKIGNESLKEDEGSKPEKANDVQPKQNQDFSSSNSKTTEEGSIKDNKSNTDENISEGKDQNNVDEKTTEVKVDETKVQSPGAQPELLNETNIQNSLLTQAKETNNEKEQGSTESNNVVQSKYKWKRCNVTSGSDYIPCLDNYEAIKHLKTTKHYEHRERHCPEDPPTCLVSLPEGYKKSIDWPTSREKIWYNNVPHTKLAEVKGHQNWVKMSGDYLTFPGGGTQFKNGALHYIDFIQQSVPDIAWGRQSRVVLDVGCGVASFGGFLFERDVITMSLAPKDEHEAQVQFALERGIPALSAVMGTKRLPFPARAFDVVHCARCRVPWHIEGGKLLLELNRLLRPGGYFVWSATPVYEKLEEDVQIWEAMKKLTNAMCWELVSKTKDRLNGVGIAIYQKPSSNECYEQRSEPEPALCYDSDDPNAAWNVPFQPCINKVPVDATVQGSQWPQRWPARLTKPPYWLLSSQIGFYGKPEPEDFTADFEHWKSDVSMSYISGMGINWSSVRNVMDMRAVYGGFAAALRDLNVWVMNVVPIDSPDTLPIIYERGLFGIYHDWCESFSTYPRSYDLLHADHIFSRIKKKCNLMALVAEADRILRPYGKLIVRDHDDVISELESIFKSMRWDIRFAFSKDKEGILSVQKGMWRPTEVETVTYAISNKPLN
ncbi:probable methyltransferase PMT26 [Impatiens glandulifera]|uniref:probable methyltransferase PMT26 n=1 Tax=Impatiens glandulifera TaxID=253017 RepID=UPI001FB12205|nr:probable methyltransferase PMT26 [Impatiens glandulifera]